MSAEKNKNGGSGRGLKVLLLARRFEVRGSRSHTLRMAERCRDLGVDCATVCWDDTRVPEKKRLGQEARGLVLRQFNVNETVRQTVDVYRPAVRAEAASVA